MKSKPQPKLIAIFGGSGAGKSWLAQRLQADLPPTTARLALDDFYLDRSHLPPSRRASANFDHPRAIDWPLLEQVLHRARANRPARLPRYSFGNHARLPAPLEWTPGSLVLVEGLWLVHRPRVRSLFDLSIYLECPWPLRLERRIHRDAAERGRTAKSVTEQFWRTVAPMHDRFVAPQMKQADIVLKGPPCDADIQRLIGSIKALCRDTGRPAKPAGPGS